MRKLSVLFFCLGLALVLGSRPAVAQESQAATTADIQRLQYDLQNLDDSLAALSTSHPRYQEFQGRADNVYDFAGGTGTDCFGSGTAVAGVVGAATYGVAKGVSLHGVRVYDCSGAGLNSDIVAGVDWVTAHHASPAVANLAVSLDPSTALTTAVKNLWNSGVFVVTTAANHTADACLEAGGASGAFTVTASTAYDTKAGFSNWGPCVQIYAPGEYIQSTWLAGQINGLPHS